MAVARPLVRRSLEDQTVMQFDSDCPELVSDHTERAVVPDLAVADNLHTALAKDMASVQQVGQVVIDEVHGALLVWVTVDDPQRAVRDRIFQKELDLIDAFPNVKFDFNLIPSMGRPIEQLVTHGNLVYSRQN